MTLHALLLHESVDSIVSRVIVVAALALLLFSHSEVLAQQDAGRFEIGGQFSLLSRNKPAGQFDDFTDIPKTVAQPGLGARVTYNLTNNISFEAEGNFFPQRDDDDFSVPGGQIYQGQFGLKVGKRLKKIGLFGKVRPGFVTFTKVSQFTGFRSLSVFDRLSGRTVNFENAEFRIGKQTYFSTDIGGVVEFYPSRRIVTRFDLGDTIIRYGIYREPLLNVCPGVAPACPLLVFERPAETKHNLQFSAGVSFRF